MTSLNVKYCEVDIVKTGKISKHTSTTKGKKYHRGKIYLPDDSFTGKRYQLMKVDQIDYETVYGNHKKGTGYLIFVG